MPAFMAECTPTMLRGMVMAQLQLQIAVAQLVAAVINFGTSTINSDVGWRTYIGCHEAAGYSLSKLRKKEISNHDIQNELDVLAHSKGNRGKGTWREVFRGTNRRRSGIALIVMIGQQITGQAFISQYAVYFYKQQGFQDAFELGVIQQALGVIQQALGVTAVIFATFIVDSFGRRNILLSGGVMTTTFLFIMGAIGTIAHPSHTQNQVMVSCFMLWFFFYLLSWAPVPYIVLGEVSSRRITEKTNNLAVSFSVLSAFLVSFTVPYLISPEYANLGAKVGFIYGSLSVIFTTLTYAFVPEMTGKSLEVLDVLFERKVPTRKFSQTRG
ncbi:MAG: hypothetical protein M1818_006627 [Claussenomyces sp. TS43310]|nr:MAG: hypothetical protein M1818_006627 [Claussenomyces sp. TS43310]